MSDGRPVHEFVPGGSDVVDRAYPYHVLLPGVGVVFRSRDAHRARAVAGCTAGQLWRTPPGPASRQYPSFCVCDFAREEWTRC